MWRTSVCGALSHKCDISVTLSHLKAQDHLERGDRKIVRARSLGRLEEMVSLAMTGRRHSEAHRSTAIVAVPAQDHGAERVSQDLPPPPPPLPLSPPPLLLAKELVTDDSSVKASRVTVNKKQQLRKI